MRISVSVLGVLVLAALPILGCGGSDEPTTISGSELERYTEQNAAEIAAQEEIDAAEEAEEEEDEDE